MDGLGTYYQLQCCPLPLSVLLVLPLVVPMYCRYRARYRQKHARYLKDSRGME